MEDDFAVDLLDECTPADDLCDAAADALFEGDEARCADLCREGLAIDPQHPSLHALLSQTLFALRRFPDCAAAALDWFNLLGAAPALELRHRALYLADDGAALAKAVDDPLQFGQVVAAASEGEAPLLLPELAAFLAALGLAPASRKALSLSMYDSTGDKAQTATAKALKAYARDVNDGGNSLADVVAALEGEESEEMRCVYDFAVALRAVATQTVPETDRLTPDIAAAVAALRPEDEKARAVAAMGCHPLLRRMAKL